MDLATALAVTILGGATVAIIARAFRERRRYSRIGYRAGTYGHDCFEYVERDAHGEQRRLVINGELMARGPRLLYAPPESRWNHVMPEWARGRRTEILGRIQDYLGPKQVEVIEQE